MVKIRKTHQIFDRWLYDNPWKQILWVLLISIVIYSASALIIITVLGIDNIPIEGYSKEERSIWWTLYYFFADPGNQMSIKGNSIAGERVVGLIMSTLGSILLSGLLISTITNVFQRGADK